MKIALTQMNIAWECPADNRQTCERLVQNASHQDCDWIVFPEMTITGFTMQPERFTPNDDVEYFRSLAIRHSIGIVFGYIADIQGQYQNKMAVLSSQGELLIDYAKIHPFSYGEESRHYTGGDTAYLCHIASDAAFYMSGCICYDLRFPELFQKISEQACVIFVIANWPEARIAHWHTLLQARAIEGQCYIVGVNRTGDGGGLHYCASSAAFDPYGNLLTPESSTDELLYAEITPSRAITYRREFPVQSDRCEFSVK